MNPFTAIATSVLRSFNYSGRASRAEYWWTFLLYLIVAIVCFVIDLSRVVALMETQGRAAIDAMPFFAFASFWCWVAMLPVFLSLTVRRLHDAGFSGFWILLNFVPFGILALIVMHVLPSVGGASSRGAMALSAGKSAGKPATLDSHQRAMQGYALLFDKDKKVTPETQAARKAEMAEYYRTKVLKPAAGV